MLKKPLFRAENLVKSFGGVQAVKDISFYINPGECLGIIGPNGAGKTTTIQMCLGLSQPTSGIITAFGLDMSSNLKSIKSRMGVVAQNDTLDPDFTCRENILVYGRYFGIKKAQLLERVPKLLEFSSLTNKEHSRPNQLSGGMKRRLSLARSLVNDPQLLLLDEPTTGLDPQARHLIWERLQRLLGDGKSILLTTHFMDEAERLCDRLLVLDHGKILAEGTPRELIDRHLEPYVVEVYGKNALDLLEGSIAKFSKRSEVIGETVFFYTNETAGLTGALEAYPNLKSVHRPTNLEDLFLKLTGREIREGA